MVPEDEEGGQVVVSARRFADGNLAKDVVDVKAQGDPRNPRNPGAVGREDVVVWKHEAGQEQRGLPRT